MIMGLRNAPDFRTVYGSLYNFYEYDIKSIEYLHEPKRT
jgi:hypothetical protein